MTGLKKTVYAGIALVCGVLLAAGCGKKGDPTVPVAPKLLPVSNIGAQLGEQGVALSWRPPTEYDTKKPLEPDDIRSFTIYRQLQLSAANSWQFSQSAEGWQEIGDTLPVKPYNGTLRAASNAASLRVHSPENLGVDAATFRYLRLKLWTKHCRTGYVTFITNADKTWDTRSDVSFEPAVHTSAASFQSAFGTIKTRAFPIEASPSATAAEYVIDMQSLPTWSGQIAQIGLAFETSITEGETAEIALESVELLPSLVERAAVYDAPPYLFADDEEGWSARGTTLFGAADGALYARGTAPMFLTSKPGQQLAAPNAQFVRLRILAEDGGEAYLVAHDSPLTSLAAETMSQERLANAARIPLAASPEWNTYDLDMRGVFAQSGDAAATTTETQSRVKVLTQLGLFFPKRHDGASRQIAIDFIDVAGSETQSASRTASLTQPALPALDTIAQHVHARQRTSDKVFDVAYDALPEVQAANANAPIKLAEISPKEVQQPDGSYAFTDTGALEVGEKDEKRTATLDEGARYAYQIEMTDRKKRKSTLATGTVVEIVKPLMPPRDLQAKPGDRTAELSWNPPLFAKDGKKARHIAEYRIFRADTAEKLPATPTVTPTVTPTEAQPAATPTVTPTITPKIGNLPATQIVALPVTQTNFIDQNLTNGQEYLYAIQAVAAASEPLTDTLSHSVSVTPLDAFAPTAPSGLVGVYLGKAVNLHWNQVQVSDFAGFHVYRSEQKESGFERLNDAPVLNATYEDATAQQNKRYYYRVTTIDDETPPNESEPAVTLVETYLLD